jgi:hypothetical protein
MRSKFFSIALFVFIIATVISCSDNVVPDFTYSPEMPKRGQKVTFTNTTTADDDWEVDNWGWNFGDGYKSTAKSPVHTFKTSGKFKVTLMVDSNKHWRKSQTITVYDTIPQIYTDEDSLVYYQKATFSVLAYNPNSEDVTYYWTFSKNAVSDSIDEDGHSTSAEFEVYFTKHDVYETVQLHIEIGDTVKDVDSTFYIHNFNARSIIMADKDGSLWRQRIIDNGLEERTNMGIASGKHPFSLQTDDNKLYIFDAGTSTGYKSNWLTDTSGDGSIRVVDMGNNNAVSEFAHNRGTSSHFGFNNGYVDKNYLYWTDFSEFVYRTPKAQSIGAFDWKGSKDAQTAVPYYLVKTDRLGYYGNGLAENQMSGGFYVYDNVYFWAKGGTGKGIYRFDANDILSSNSTGNVAAPAYGAILTDYAIRAFTVDEINQKIYFSVTAPADKVGLWVSNLSGSGATRIDDSPMGDASEYITGIAVDNVSNKVYWAYTSPYADGSAYFNSNPATHRTGIKMATLATLYKPAGAIQYFSLGVSAYGLVLDEVGKK